MRRGAVLTLAALLLALSAAPAPAAGLDVRIRQTSLDPNGTTRIVVAVDGGSDPRFEVRENGRPVGGVRVTPISEAAGSSVAVMLTMDVSGSTAGAALADAKAAARRFVAGLPAVVRVGLISFGPSARVRLSPTTDRRGVYEAIDGLAARGGTSLYDAVVLAAGTLGRSRAQANIVLFSDGADTDSTATLAAAVRAARSAAAPVFAVGLQTKDFDAASLDALAGRTDGRSVRVGESGGLARAFEALSRQISSQYVISYRGSSPGEELDVAVTAVAGGATAGDEVTVLNPRVASPAAPGTAGRPLVPVFASRLGLWIGAAAMFAVLAVLLAFALGRPHDRRAAGALRSVAGTATAPPSSERDDEGSAFAASSLGRAAVAAVERLSSTAGLRATLQRRIERAGWPLRASEFLLAQAGAGLAGGILGYALLGRWWMGVPLAAAGAAAPRLVLEQRIQRRTAAFLAQLPDTLQLLAGSLQAGYGFLQALDTLVREAPAPTSNEFSRVLTEARLGVPLNDALQAMADRVGSEDFTWVVLAVNVQREVGGNLAALLHTVSDTLRERDQVRRQIKVLSAEGRISAIILGVLPFGIAGYIMTVNPDYLRTLFSSSMGKVMIAGALALMGAGIVWMRKLIRIRV